MVPTFVIYMPAKVRSSPANTELPFEVDQRICREVS